MKSKKAKPKPTDEPIPNPLLVNEEEFTEIVRKMANTSPVERKHYRRNPETDPRYLPVFDFKEKIRIEQPKKKSRG
jgi:hypothetical protein